MIDHLFVAERFGAKSSLIYPKAKDQRKLFRWAVSSKAHKKNTPAADRRRGEMLAKK